MYKSRILVTDMLRDLTERLVENERKFSTNSLDDPRGIFTRLGRSTQLLAARQFGSYNIDRDVISSVENSFYPLDQNFSSKTMKQISEVLHPHMENEELADIQELNGSDTLHVLGTDDFDFREEIDEIQEILDREHLKKAVHQYFGSSFRDTWAGSVWYHQDFQGRSGNWHIDFRGARRTSTIRLLIFLSDESGNKGAPLEVVSPTETRRLLDKYSYSQIQENPEIVEKNADIKRFSGPPGSAVLFTPGLQLHRATHPRKENHVRKILLFNLEPDLTLV